MKAMTETSSEELVNHGLAVILSVKLMLYGVPVDHESKVKFPNAVIFLSSQYVQSCPYAHHRPLCLERMSRQVTPLG